MNDLTSRALELQHAAHELMYLGMDGEPVYSDTFCRLNKEVLVKSDSLFSAQSSDVEEEANLCLALLMGYNATIYDYGDKERKKQVVLERIYNVLEKLPVSLLKVHLLVYTYGEVYEESMRCETYNIMKNWNMLDLSTEQKKQMVLNRICLVLEQLPASLLKVRLLTYTYGEVYEEVLFQEAYAIIEGWNKDNLSSEQTEIIEELKNIEENPYPFEEVE